MNIIEPRLDGTNLRIGIVQARFTNEIGSEMVKVCCRTLKELGVAEDNITLATVPGALEVPIALMNLASSEQFDALIAIGVVIRGETYHLNWYPMNPAQASAALPLITTSRSPTPS